MMLNLYLKMLFDFCLPGTNLSRGCQGRPSDAHAQGQGMLVLARERNQTWIAKHAPPSLQVPYCSSDILAAPVSPRDPVLY